MSKLQLYVKNISGETVTISCLSVVKICDLKDLISNKIEIGSYMIRLLYKNRELDDDLFLNESGITNETTLYYMIKLNEEVETLMEIKRYWNLDNNWSRDLHLREWDRIDVNDDGNIILLQLSCLNISGDIPRRICNLKHLEELHLSNNNLTGKIPKEIYKLKKLKELCLFDNKLTGEIPKEIRELKKLKALCLDCNKLTGKIPREIFNLTSLRYINLHCNNLVGEIPKEIGKLQNLSELTLCDNELTGSIPREIANNIYLEKFYIFSNKLKYDIPIEIKNLQFCKLDIV